MRNDRVAAVVVTYNRLPLLQKCIERLEAQESENTQKILSLRETVSVAENAVEKLKEEYELMEDKLLNKLITVNKHAKKTLL